MPLAETNFNQPFLFETVVPARACERCKDTGIWLSPRNEVLICPVVQMRGSHVHNSGTLASQIFERAAYRLEQMEIPINSMAFTLAQILTHYTTEKPLSRRSIFEYFFADTNLTEEMKRRKLALLIEELRFVWMMPLGARKDEPSGYWICTNLDDYAACVRGALSAPSTQFSNWHKNAKHNYPEFAEQLKLEFTEAEVADGVD